MGRNLKEMFVSSIFLLKHSYSLVGLLHTSQRSPLERHLSSRWILREDLKIWLESNFCVSATILNRKIRPEDSSGRAVRFAERILSESGVGLNTRHGKSLDFLPCHSSKLAVV